MRNIKLLHPQEIEVFYIIPALRRELARSLKQLGFDQKKTAQLLNITEAAVSQYLNEKRATDVSFSHKIKKEIMQSAERLKKNSNLIEETQKLLRIVRSELITCKTCNILTSTNKSCRICFE